jgi:aldehyde dehydrogenase (NAD+)
VAAIVPWNSPLSTAVVKIAPALIAGCTVILKPAPETPIEAYIIAEAAEAVGLPKGVLNVLTADRAVSEELVRHPGIDKITFTGSSAAGKKIAAIAGERVARYTLELGGKSAAVVLDDYDVGAVAQAIAGSTCIMANQVCCALSRVVVTRKRHDDLVDAFRTAFGAIRVGDPYDPDTQMGPLAMARQRERVESYIAKGKEEATLAVGGGRPSHLNRGFYVEPTVFANVDNRSAIAQEEIFGPVVAIVPAEDEDHAVAIANDTVFGLNSAVFTNDVDRAYEVGRQMRAGTVGHNGFKIDFGIGFGGFKQSGIGREGGREGLLPFLEAKTMLLDGTPGRLG